MQIDKGFMKYVSDKTNSEISAEWDDIAIHRMQQIENKLDLSYDYVLTPAILKLLDNCNLKNVIDVGCGIGHMTHLLSKKVELITGVDLSPKSINLAKNSYCADNIRYINSSIENFASDFQGLRYTLAIANMFLMDTLYLESSIYAISKLLERSANLIFSITHPCFWSIHWGYINESWFDYKKEIIIESKFEISLDKMENISTHIHRPLERYIETLFNNGFLLNELYEPMPNKEIQDKYPDQWKFPRFLIGICSKK